MSVCVFGGGGSRWIGKWTDGRGEVFDMPVRPRRQEERGVGAQRGRAVESICVSGALQEMKNENEKEKRGVYKVHLS